MYNFKLCQKQINPLHEKITRAQRSKASFEDNHRKSAVSKRHAKGKRTARENIEDLCDPNSFQEIGGLIVAAQKGRKSIKELRDNTPADGLISGIGTINAAVFPEGTNCYILSYDYTVLAGTQGAGHKKTDRLMELAHKAHCPILFL